MPYLIATHSGGAAREAAEEKPPFGPGFSAEIVQHLEKLEVWGSSLNDPGEDWTEFQAINGAGKMIACKREAGY